MDVTVYAEPGPDNGYLAGHARLLFDSHLRLTGRPLLAAVQAGEAGRALYFASIVVLSHDVGAEPRFTYANRAAQALFEMSWTEIVGLPSRLSAEPLARDERQRLLERVAVFGHVDDYSGVRISKSGRRFRIERATVWNLIDTNGHRLGQAAAFDQWLELK